LSILSIRSQLPTTVTCGNKSNKHTYSMNSLFCDELEHCNIEFIRDLVFRVTTSICVLMQVDNFSKSIGLVHTSVQL
jgi:hypothetical protein